MKKHLKGRTARGGLYSILSGFGVSLLSLISLSLIGGALLMALENPMGAIGAAFLAVFMACAAISGFINSRRGGDGGVLSSVISGALFISIMLIIALIAEKGAIGLGTLMNYLCYMLVTALFSFLGKKRVRRRRR